MFFRCFANLRGCVDFEAEASSCDAEPVPAAAGSHRGAEPSGLRGYDGIAEVGRCCQAVPVLGLSSSTVPPQSAAQVLESGSAILFSSDDKNCARAASHLLHTICTNLGAEQAQ